MGDKKKVWSVEYTTTIDASGMAGFSVTRLGDEYPTYFYMVYGRWVFRIHFTTKRLCSWNNIYLKKP